MSQIRAQLDEVETKLSQLHVRGAVIRTKDSASPGDTVPDLTLLDEAGQPITLGEIVANHRAVFIFYHGTWSTRCAETLRRYQRELLPELARRRVQLVGISPQTPDGSQYTRDLNSLIFPLLSDIGNEFASALGIRDLVDPDPIDAIEMARYAAKTRNSEGDWELPHPTTLILDQTRTVHFIDVRLNDLPPTHPKDILLELG
ncbi:AhpC/TSA family protein [Nocardia sp. NBC_01499]|uniref:peroxiredoxin-like family protein n=1 Tax=Nocardia sp. NBC_01499 TaxID=2903597 RepID=UPI003866503F